MKLRNKKTGDIAELFGITCMGARTFLRFDDGKGIFKFEVRSLSELNAEWEDYEEPTTYYYISDFGAIREGDVGKFVEDEIFRKEIGNYFKTKEEAENVVERLRALKRLKDKNFKFRKLRTANIGGDKHYFAITAEVDDADKTDLDLLFSGGEDG